MLPRIDQIIKISIEINFLTQNKKSIHFSYDPGSTITKLGLASFNVTPGAWYRLRLETIGNYVRGYVNGRLVIEATDNAPTAGQAGVVTYRTQADFDDFNAVVP